VVYNWRPQQSSYLSDFIIIVIIYITKKILVHVFYKNKIYDF